MSQTIDAVYENGVLRPLAPLGFREHQCVRLTVSERDDADPLDAMIDWECIAACALEADDSITLEEVRVATSKIRGSLTEAFIAERDERF